MTLNDTQITKTVSSISPLLQPGYTTIKHDNGMCSGMRIIRVFWKQEKLSYIKTMLDKLLWTKQNKVLHVGQVVNHF